jgi:hypothetical protein
MRRSSVLTTFISGTFVFGAVVAASDAEARLDLYVDKSTQRIQIIQNGTLLYVWPVSTGRDRFSTPSGVYTPERLERSWFSRAYYNAPMPHAIFFHNGYAIHGSYDIARLGGPASHGCVRLHPRNAALLFAMVQQEGPDNTTIFVGGNSRRPLLRYPDDDAAWRPPYRRDTPVARGYPPEPGFDRRMPPGEGPERYVDRQGAYPPPAPERPYYNPDRYDGPDHYADKDRYADQGRYPRGPDVAPYSETDRSLDRRRVPYSPRLGARPAARAAASRLITQTIAVPTDAAPVRMVRRRRPMTPTATPMRRRGAATAAPARWRCGALTRQAARRRRVWTGKRRSNGRLSSGCPLSGCRSKGCPLSGCRSKGCPSKGCLSKGCRSIACPSSGRTARAESSGR